MTSMIKQSVFPRVAPVERLMSVGLVERVAQVKRIAPVTKVVVVRLSSIARRLVSIALARQ